MAPRSAPDRPSRFASRYVRSADPAKPHDLRVISIPGAPEARDDEGYRHPAGERELARQAHRVDVDAPLALRSSTPERSSTSRGTKRKVRRHREGGAERYPGSDRAEHDGVGRAGRESDYEGNQWDGRSTAHRQPACDPFPAEQDRPAEPRHALGIVPDGGPAEWTPETLDVGDEHEGRPERRREAEYRARGDAGQRDESDHEREDGRLAGEDVPDEDHVARGKRRSDFHPDIREAERCRPCLDVEGRPRRAASSRSSGPRGRASLGPSVRAANRTVCDGITPAFASAAPE